MHYLLSPYTIETKLKTSPMTESVSRFGLRTLLDSIMPRSEKAKPAMATNHRNSPITPHARPSVLNCLHSFSGFFDGASCIIISILSLMLVLLAS